ncbi:DUF1848 domain-containing protein [Thermosediminibacter oceani]|uniref:DUF1848 domain-containing protein n=1 Tax=Thermosediminibacter oceani (strain ATCC BAA-1034 / DSM 16646 / JW/IW-1228P) TaxID=555079 RepID=D9S1R1_THEOJ|nr:DUF1848 domain-containing protein [Thermosediminibacter oceani]ADL07338.1 Domain of unknown function DUF1848 [Thermosediminibacter oceani DSM 16646]
MIISASRRTDIPAFYAGWFMDKVRKGRVVVYNPFNGVGWEVSLKSEDVDAVVFWSKNFGPLLPALDELKEKYRLYFLFTITGLHGILEDNVIPADEAVEQFIEISRKFSPGHIQWRFDPIVITNVTGEDFYLEKFESIARKLKGYTRRCYISFATIYDKVKRNFAVLERERGIRLTEWDEDKKRDFANRLGSIARDYGIRVYSCCNEFLIGEYVERGSCVDVNLINELYSAEIKSPLHPTRPGCGCYKSVDIGVYNTCPHGCRYCYANHDAKKALENYRSHNPCSDFLVNRELKMANK